MKDAPHVNVLLQLTGSADRLCLPSGQWTGQTAVCSLKICRKISSPQHGWIRCSSGNFGLDTVCQFGCGEGYRLVGSNKRTCLPTYLWSGLPAHCKRKGKILIVLTMTGSEVHSKFNNMTFLSDIEKKRLYHTLSALS